MAYDFTYCQKKQKQKIHDVHRLVYSRYLVEQKDIEKNEQRC